VHVIVYITASNIEEAKDLSEAVINERLAACASIVEKVSSIYHWKGKIEKNNESLLILKTREDKMDALTVRVKQLHSYENPEIVAVPIVKGSGEYLDWIDGALNPKR